MDRREFLHAGIMATLAAKVLSDVTLATSPQTPAQPPAGAPAAAAGQPGRLRRRRAS
jgi:hypothetical protein